MRRYVAGLAVLLALAACSSADDGDPVAAGDTATAASTSPSAPFTLAPPSQRPLSGTLEAELQQSSRDVALGRFQVWITNGLDREIRPRRIVYRDQLLTRPELAGRLRPIPSGSYRGYTLDLVEPRCGATSSGPATVTVFFARDEVTVPVEDETSVTGRWAAERCAEIAVDEVAPLSWTGVTVRGSGEDAVGLFRLTATPTGRGGSYTIDTVTGTPLYTSAEGEFWEVHRRIRGTGGPTSIELPAQPARCDVHAFGSATGGTTFFVNLTIDGEPAQVRLAMSPELTDDAFAYAGEVCGF